MGRKQKYTNTEDKNIARRKQQMEYYWRNQEEIKKKNLRRYHAKKSNIK